MADENRSDPASSVEGAAVTIIPEPASTINVVCSECGATVDTVEYNSGESQVAAQIANLLAVDLEEAERIVQRHNASALKSGRDRAMEFAELIASKEVEGRPAATYVCRNGHDDAALEVNQ